MKPLRAYNIAYVGLKLGVHTFEYDIDSSFFKHFEDSPISECKVHVRLEFEKKETFFVLSFFIDGTVNVACDRCLERFDKPIFSDFKCFVKFTEDPSLVGEDDEVMFISRDDSHVDVSHLIYEYINLSLPMQIIHPKKANGEEGCNPEVLKYLSNKEKETDEQDPRWSELSKLKLDSK